MIMMTRTSIALAVFATSASAALRVFPESITLDSAAARQSIVVQQITADGLTLDVTSAAAVKLPTDAPAAYDSKTSTFSATKDGEAKIEITAAGETSHFLSR